MNQPKSWLLERGFDLDDPEWAHKRLKSRRIPWVSSTPLYEAAALGELKVCRYVKNKQGAALP